jgi:hypothetical protein
MTAPGANRPAQLATLAFALFLAVGARADSIWLRGGEKLIGRVVTEAADQVSFESQTLGKLEVARDRIERIERDAPPVSMPKPKFAVDAWAAGPSNDDDFDWIQLKSGEWLKGRIKSLQDEKLEFDSEELDLLTFDWEKIRTVRSPRLLSVRIEKREPMDGSLLVTANEVQVVTATLTNSYPRAELLAITPTGTREIDKWTGKVTAGVSFRAGNTRETDVDVHAAFQRRTPDTRLNLDYLGNYGKINGSEVEQNHRFIGQFDYFLSRRLYVRLPDVEYYRDPLQNLDHRLTLGAGVGYDLVKTPRTEWNVTVSPSWQRNWFSSVPVGEDATVDSVAWVLSTRFDAELTQKLDFIFEYRGQLSRQETGNDTHHAVTTLEFEIRKHLNLDVSFVWDRISSPQTESGGGTPTPDDFRLITALGVDF